jgi:hypothetical protein
LPPAEEQFAAGLVPARRAAACGAPTFPLPSRRAGRYTVVMADEKTPQAGGRDYMADWLGIPPEHRPASLYALCGAPDLTADIQQIRQAATAHIQKLRPFATHPVHGPAACKLLETVGKAMTLLTDPVKKERYDKRLRSRKLHAISLLGKKLLDGGKERLAEFVDGAYAASGTFPVREVEAAIVETYRKCSGQRFTFSRLSRYLSSPAWHSEAHLLARLDQQIHQRQRVGERFRRQRHAVMADGKRFGLSPAQVLAVWANRVQYELTLDRTLASWGLAPDGSELKTDKAPGIGFWPWVTVANTALATLFVLIAMIVHGCSAS